MTCPAITKNKTSTNSY